MITSHEVMPGHYVHSGDNAALVTAAMLEELGTDDPAALVDASVEQLLAAQQAVGQRAELTARTFLPFMPTVDGVVLDQTPVDAIAGGVADGIRVVTGTTSDEWNLFHVMERVTAATEDPTP